MADAEWVDRTQGAIHEQPKSEKLIAGATVLGLGALGGAAMGTNQGLPAPRQLAANGSGPIVTSASGAVVAQPAGTPASARPPIVTRASGGGAPVEIDY